MKMKPRMLFAALLLLSVVRAGAFERCYVSTDRAVYVAGDIVWCSVFCLDGNGRLSSESALAYVEIASSQGTSVTGKIALMGGRGAGAISIPLQVPTGNYRLFAYTALEKQESDFDPLPGSKLVSIFNTGSTSRVRGGVEIVEDYDAVGQVGANPGNLSLEVRGANLVFTLPEQAGVSVSIYHDDGIKRPGAVGPAEFLKAVPRAVAYPSRPEAEFDGEVIRGTLYGADVAKVVADPASLAVISSPGSAGDSYLSKLGPDGKLTFRTNNIYGHRDLVCEILGMGEGTECHFEPDDPFLRPETGVVEPLRMNASLLGALESRSRAMRAERTADTLYEFLPKRENLLLNHEDRTVYHLDDYVRFNTIQDIIVEIVPELVIRRSRSGGKELRMVLRDARSNSVVHSRNVLALLDGVPVTDITHLLDFDAMLLSDLHLYPYTYSLGGVVFEGIVDFITTTGDISSLAFDPNVRIVDFDGVSYPVAYTCKDFEPEGEDIRQLLYWHPLVVASEGETVSIPFRLPAYEGRFRAVVEGFSASGKPLYGEIEF